MLLVCMQHFAATWISSHFAASLLICGTVALLNVEGLDLFINLSVACAPGRHYSAFFSKTQGHSLLSRHSPNRVFPSGELCDEARLAKSLPKACVHWCLPADRTQLTVVLRKLVWHPVAMRPPTRPPGEERRTRRRRPQHRLIHFECVSGMMSHAMPLLSRKRHILAHRGKIGENVSRGSKRAKTKWQGTSRWSS